LAHVLGVDPEIGLQRDLHVHALRHVDEAAAGPDGGVERRELVVTRWDHAGEVLLEQFGMLPEPRVGVQEDDALLLQVLADLVVDHLGLVLRGDAGDESLLFRLGDAELVVGVLDVRGKLVPAGGLLLGRPDEVLDVVEVDAGQVRAPVGHGLAPEQLVALQPEIEHPLWLVLLGRDIADDLLGQAAARRRAGHVRVGPAELVTLKPLQFGVCGGRHAEMPPGSVVAVWGWWSMRSWCGSGPATGRSRAWCRCRRRGRWWPAAAPGCPAGGRTPRSPPRTAAGTRPRR